MNAETVAELEALRLVVFEREAQALEVEQKRAALAVALTTLTPDTATPAEYLELFAQHALTANAVAEAAIAVHAAKLAVTHRKNRLG
jgi:hypothetical protein